MVVFAAATALDWAVAVLIFTVFTIGGLIADIRRNNRDKR